MVSSMASKFLHVRKTPFFNQIPFSIFLLVFLSRSLLNGPMGVRARVSSSFLKEETDKNTDSVPIFPNSLPNGVEESLEETETDDFRSFLESEEVDDMADDDDHAHVFMVKARRIFEEIAEVAKVGMEGNINHPPSRPPPRPRFRPPPRLTEYSLDGSFSRGLYTIDIVLGSQKVTMLPDTGSGLIWVNCAKPNKPLITRRKPFDPTNSSLVDCRTDYCTDAQITEPTEGCGDSKDRTCPYVYHYIDGLDTASGYLVTSNTTIRIVKENLVTFPLVVGCNKPSASKKITSVHATDGIIGFGFSNTSLPNQLASATGIDPIFGHCFAPSGGYFFIGKKLVPKRKVVWIPLKGPLAPFIGYYFSATSVEIAGKRIKCDFGALKYQEVETSMGYGSQWSGGFKIDSGATTSSFVEELYLPFVKLMRNVVAMRTNELTYSYQPKQKLKACWSAPLGSSILTYERYSVVFPEVSINFVKDKGDLGKGKRRWKMWADQYIVKYQGKLCLAVNHVAPSTFGESSVIGAISMRQSMIIYDQNLMRIGISKRDCNNPP